MSTTKARAGFLILALAANLVVFSALDVRAAHACSCASVTPEEQLESSDAVFAGEATEIAAEDLAPGGGLPLGRVTFDATETWKGTPEGPVEVFGQGPGMSCGLNFDEGKSYLVYAYRTGDHLETGLCTATKPLAEAQADLRLLGSPIDDLPNTGGPAPGVVAVVALLILAGALMVGGRGRA